jgi:glyoxylase-like metal-dependent hydrolase (beta-lactamase superfamily II)
MSGIEIGIIKLGEVEHDRAFSVGGLVTGAVENKTPPAVWARLCFNCAVIKHPQAGYILFDTGNYWDVTKMLAQYIAYADYYIGREDYIDRQLARIHLTVDDISRIFLSHAHFDHAGGLAFFAGTRAGKNVYITRTEFENALLTAYETPEIFHDFYHRGDFQLEGIEYHFIEEEGEILPGIEVIFLGGHTPGVMGLVVHCDGGVFILPSDAVYLRENLGPPPALPSVLTDSRAFIRNAERIEKLREKYDATVIFPHDLEQFQTIKTIPYFYK